MYDNEVCGSFLTDTILANDRHTQVAATRVRPSRVASTLSASPFSPPLFLLLLSHSLFLGTTGISVFLSSDYCYRCHQRLFADRRATFIYVDEPAWRFGETSATPCKYAGTSSIIDKFDSSLNVSFATDRQTDRHHMMDICFKAQHVTHPCDALCYRLRNQICPCSARNIE